MSSKLTVMVVEDEVLLLQAIHNKLEVSGIRSLPYSSGEEALKYLTDKAKTPNVIWLDYYLADMSGQEFMMAIKENPAIDDVPVIVVSNSASDEKVRQLTALGVRKYIQKTAYRLDEIVQMVRELATELQPVAVTVDNDLA
jgi:CheY-like chemotaxis protein